jgi:hypothetical protein
MTEVLDGAQVISLDERREARRDELAASIMRHGSMRGRNLSPEQAARFNDRINAQLIAEALSLPGTPPTPGDLA